MKEKIAVCLALSTAFVYAQDTSQIDVSLTPFAQEQRAIVPNNILETKEVDPEHIAQPIINEDAIQITEPTDISQEQFLQELLNIMTPEERAAFEQEAQFLPDRFQPEDLSDLNATPDNNRLSDISDEELIQLIEALSEQPDFPSFEDEIQ